MDKNERRICWYSSLLIMLLVNTPKLLALREDGIVAQYWHFNLPELLVQMLITMAFCLFFLRWNLDSRWPVSHWREQKRPLLYHSVNVALVLVLIAVAAFLQRRLFDTHQLPQVYRMGYFARIGMSALLCAIIVKIVLLIRNAKRKESENAQLKSAYMAAELELLKEQMNPHFLFNSLSSLSGVIREDPERAQKYVRELSNVFRYTLTRSDTNLVTLEEELNMLHSFAQLITMRLEDAFRLNIDMDDTLLKHKLPHLSLQPLLENAVKHNAATLLNPLTVDICAADGEVVVTNNLKPIALPEASTGLGLVNLNERFRIMTGREIVIEKTATSFIVKLPLQP